MSGGRLLEAARDWRRSKMIEALASAWEQNSAYRVCKL